MVALAREGMAWLKLGVIGTLGVCGVVLVVLFAILMLVMHSLEDDDEE